MTALIHCGCTLRADDPAIGPWLASNARDVNRAEIRSTAKAKRARIAA